MRTPNRITALIAGGLITMLALAGCYSNEEYDQRKALQKQTTKQDSLEQKNLEKKLEREDAATAIRYVYLMNFGQIVGYYTIEGKVSSSGSQLAPEQEVIQYYGEPNILDSAQDDGTFGAGDPGVFFFTTEDVMVETSLDYIISDAPLPIDLPRLNEAARAK